MSPRSPPQEPCSPQIFFGRDSELAQIIDMIFTHVDSHPARIAILGPGGYGKTTLANAVLTQGRVKERFKDAIYIVACESVISSGALLNELAKTLGFLNGASDPSWSHIRDALESKDSILCFDNFESPWDEVGDQDGQTRASVEELLSRVAGLQHTTLMITMRGIVRPARTRWTKPFLPPLTSLDPDAARQVWEDIADNYDSSAEELMKAVDYVPLATTLLARLAQATLPELLLKEWNEKQTELIHTGHGNRQSSLEYSIQLSIDSGRMRANPAAKEMLGILSMLPDGVHISLVTRWKRELYNVDIPSGLRTLQECSLITMMGQASSRSQRYQMHPIIRNYCNYHSLQTLVSQEHKDAIRQFYLKLASFQPHKIEAKGWFVQFQQVNNTKAILFDLLKSDFSDYKKLNQAICTFTLFHGSIGDYSDNLINQAAEFLQQKRAPIPLQISCLQQWALLYYHAYDLKKAKQKIKEAETLCQTISDMNSSHAKTFHIFGQIHLHENDILKAKASFQKALELYDKSNDNQGQGLEYAELGAIYVRLNELDKAIASYQNALNKLGNSVLGQGNVYLGLGTIYLRQNKLLEARGSYQKALEFHKLANDMLGQANDYERLGHTYVLLNQQVEAYDSFERASRLHRHSNDILGQGNDYLGLGDIYLSLNELDTAEGLYQKALKIYKLSNNILKQGNALQQLGRVQRARSRFEDAKTLFENALTLHRQAQDPAGQEEDQHCLSEVLSEMHQP
jgi:tetratricopeptide (TPR) repeat protein